MPLATIVRLLGSLTATLVAYGAYKILKLMHSQVTSPLRDLPGPKSPSFIYGHMKEIWAAEKGMTHEKWVQEYGPTIQYKTFFCVLVVEGDKHKQQRKVMNPAFGPSQIREFTEIFVSKSIELRDRWALEINRQSGESRIDALSWLSRATLDVIGLAGFNYKFNAIAEDLEKNELSAAFDTMFKGSPRLTMIPMLRTFIPILRFLKTDQDVRAADAKKKMSRIGEELLQESKSLIRDKETQRDLLTLMVKSNMATDLPENQRMSDQDVLAQVPTFLIAGHETTTTGTAWALFALTQNKAAQDKLRKELLAVNTDNPTMEQLNALSYLDMVVRETMRLHAPVPNTMRTAVKDDTIPLNQPITDRKGVVHESIMIPKGQTLMIPIIAVNRDKSVWGEDAREFRPERWENIPEAATHIPGVWGNMLTFLGGPRACIGYRFSLVETKALLFTLVRAFEFDLAVPAKDIMKKSSLVQRPVLVTDTEGRSQMPLIIRPVVRS
ncbi:Bifunctional P-450/NADPH-P450 reductase [Termitomyces sp. J132]|nr:Bifunctional P-450/NADPH-P450 reductase [Termitomyces sp. J132]